MTTLKAGIAAALLFGTLGAQAANLVSNGSFEADSQSASAIRSSLTAWTGGAKGIELHGSGAGAAQNGLNFVELDTTKNSSMRQSINITQAGSYALSFWYRASPAQGNSNANTDTLGWSFAGASGSVLNNWKLAGSDNWQQFKTVLTVTGTGSQALSFSALGRSDSHGGWIDNVFVSAVPEPDTFAMLLAGFGLMAAVARRRKVRKTV